MISIKIQAHECCKTVEIGRFKKEIVHDKTPSYIVSRHKIQKLEKNMYLIGIKLNGTTVSQAIYVLSK